MSVIVIKKVPLQLGAEFTPVEEALWRDFLPSLFHREARVHVPPEFRRK